MPRRSSVQMRPKTPASLLMVISRLTVCAAGCGPECQCRSTQRSESSATSAKRSQSMPCTSTPLPRNADANNTLTRQRADSIAHVQTPGPAPSPTIARAASIFIPASCAVSVGYRRTCHHITGADFCRPKPRQQFLHPIAKAKLLGSRCSAFSVISLAHMFKGRRVASSDPSFHKPLAIFFAQGFADRRLGFAGDDDINPAGLRASGPGQ